MTEPEIIRVFVNGAGLSIIRGSTVLDAVRAHDPVLADALVAGTRAVTDSRGLPVTSDTSLAGGAVLRIVSARVLHLPESDG